jgi:cytidylate kinase
LPQEDILAGKCLKQGQVLLDNERLKLLTPSLIAIDGPVAAGKSTVGRILAQKLGYRFIDTGAMYRALTWFALHHSVNLDDEKAIEKLAHDVSIDIASPAKGERFCPVFIGRYNVTTEICSAEVEAGVSQVSKIAGVRETLVVQQQRIAEEGNIVMAGRDIGTVVLPRAELKIFLVASTEERARRRYLEQVGQGKADYHTILAELRRRDEIDSQRLLSPLHPASDAVILDTEGIGPEEVAAQILALIRES